MAWLLTALLAPIPAVGAEKAPPAPKDEVISAAVFPLRAKSGVDGVTAELLTLTIVEELRGTSSFSQVLSPHEVGVRLSPKEQETLMDCASDRCAILDTEMAGALGASHMLMGSIFKVDKDYLLNLKMLDIRTALEVSSVSKNISGNTNALLSATKALLGELLKKCKFLKVTAGGKAASSPLPLPTPKPVLPPVVVPVPPPTPAPEPAVTTLMAVPDVPSRAPSGDAATAPEPPKVVPPWAPGVLGGGVTAIGVGGVALVGAAVVGTLATSLLWLVYVVPTVNRVLLADKPAEERLPRLKGGSSSVFITKGVAWSLVGVGAVLLPVAVVLLVAGVVATSAGGALSRE